MTSLFTKIVSVVMCLVAWTAAALADSDWPAVLVIDDFEGNLDKWHNEDAGTLSIVDGAPDGSRAMRWTARDDGIGHITLKNLDRKTIDFSQYDLLMFDIKIDGKPIWNMGPIVQQFPAVYGYRGLYYSIDTMHPFGKWFSFTQDLSRWENAWPDTYDREKQEFQFEIAQLAGPGKTRIDIDNIRLIKNPIGLKPSYPGRWSATDGGGQVTHFRLSMHNRGDQPMAVRIALADPPGTLSKFDVELPDRPVNLLAGEQGDALVRVLVSPVVIKEVRPYYGETIRIAVRIDGMPELVLFTDLVAGVRPGKLEHPMILCDAERMRQLQQQYRKPEKFGALDRRWQRLIQAGEKALSHVAEYPPNAALGRKTDPVSGGKLVKIDVPNLPFNVYQDPISGRTYSGPLYDAGMLGWLGKHMANASAAKSLGVAYLITGRKEMAVAAGAILSAYADRYPSIPKIPYDPASPAGSDVSGVTPIGGTYMRERVWLSNLAIALDAIRPSGIFNQQQIDRIANRVFQPSADNMMDHKVGAMNLQWQIQSAALFAGLAVDHPGVVARALHDQHGIVRLSKVGFLPDGQWWENPSYQGVTKIAAYPALSTAIHNGLIPWTQSMQTILKAAYKLHGPDGRSPTLGTGGYRNLNFEDTGAFMFSNLIDDPELVWVLHHRQPHVGTYGMYMHALFRTADPKVSKDDAVNPVPKTTTHFPHYGGIALRIPGTDRYCYFHFGRELVHGHRNKLSINAYGAGGWYARNVMGGYGHNFKNFLETVASSNTIMVDGRNPDADTGELLYHHSDDNAAIASAREVGAWKNVEHERTVVLTRGPLVVIDRCVGDKPHTYDWLYHPNQTNLKLITRPPSGETSALGDSRLYSSLKPIGRLAQGQPTTWARDNGSGMTLALEPTGELWAMKISDTYRAHESLLWRQRGKTVSFISVFDPHAKDESSAVTIERLTVKDSNSRDAELSAGLAVRVTTNQFSTTVLVNYTGKTLHADRVTGDKRVAVDIAAIP